VALTYTLNATFGSHLVVAGTGVILNNEMDDFAAKPGEPNQFGLRQGERNAVVPGRRMLSSMCPTLVLHDGVVRLAAGSPGGPRILTAVALVTLRHIGDGLPLEVAVLMPRFHHQHLPDTVYVEDYRVRWPSERERPDVASRRVLRGSLRFRGHDVAVRRHGIGRVTAIAVDPESGVVTGVADPRGPGRAESE
jgi:gamma-glutamyltranspeptidase/glutathione hydrolase